MADFVQTTLLYTIHYSSCIVSIIFGTILIVVTAKASASNITSYIVLLRILTISEISASVGGFFLFPRLIPFGIDGSFIHVGGPIKFITTDKVIWSRFYVFEDHGCVQYNVFMTICFCYRYYVLKYRTPTVSKTRIFGMAVASISTASFIALCFSPLMNDDELIFYIDIHVPQYRGEREHMFGYTDILKSLATPAVALSALTSPFQSCINIFFGRAILRILANAQISDKTRKIHRQFSTALIVQCVIGQLITFTIVGFLLYLTGIVRAPIFEYTTHVVHQFCIATSPIITLYFVIPFRKVLNSWWGTGQVNNLPSKTSISTTKQNGH